MLSTKLSFKCNVNLQIKIENKGANGYCQDLVIEIKNMKIHIQLPNRLCLDLILNVIGILYL